MHSTKKERTRQCLTRAGSIALAGAIVCALPSCSRQQQNATPAIEETKDEEQEAEEPRVVPSKTPKQEQAELPPFGEVDGIKAGTIFEFDCSATTSASARAATHYIFTTTYGDSDSSDEYANMDMDYKKYRDDIERGTRLHIRCKFVDADYKGAPNFEVIWYRVIEQ